MTIYEEIKSKLERHPLARERSHKNRFIATMLFKKYDMRMQTGMDVALVEGIGVDFSSYDRAWRQVLQHEASLRGKDYDDKKTLEQERELELGYQPGFFQDIKKANTF